MPNPRDLARGRTRMLPLIAFTLREGWDVSRTASGRLTFVKAGLPPIFTGPVATGRPSGRALPNGRPEKTGARHG